MGSSILEAVVIRRNKLGMLLLTTATLVGDRCAAVTTELESSPLSTALGPSHAYGIAGERERV